MVVGLTGGVASGKSVVADFFRELGAHIIDWDVLAREVVCPHLRAWEGIVEYFGKDILGDDLTINRRELGQIVFNDEMKLEKLNQITHPEIFKEDRRLTAEIEKLAPDALIVKDIPLLVEVAAQKLVDRIVVVYASEETQMKRLVGKGLSQEDARTRIAAQLPLSEKVRYADFVIYNDGSLEETKRQVERVYALLRRGNGGRAERSSPGGKHEAGPDREG